MSRPSRRSGAENIRSVLWPIATGHCVRAMDDGVEVASIQLAANLASPVESDIEPSAELSLGGQELAEPKVSEPALQRSVWLYLVLLVFGMLLIEWYTYNRRITV